LPLPAMRPSFIVVGGQWPVYRCDASSESINPF
jgi:hypothetical protein